MKSSFNRFLAIMIAISVALMGLRIATAGESRYSREREAKREAIYEEGYKDGYNEAPDADAAYEDGFSDCKRLIINRIYDAATYPDNELMILEDYFSGEATRDEAREAFEQVLDYCDTVDSAIRSLDNIGY